LRVQVGRIIKVFGIRGEVVIEPTSGDPGRFAPGTTLYLAENGEESLTVARCRVRGGRLIVSVPNVAHWTVRFGLLAGSFDYAETGILDRTHLRFFTRESLLEVCAEAGLVVEETAFTTNAFPLRKLVSHGMRRKAAALLPGPLAYQFVLRLAPARA
jgi:hypothetical protein